MRANGFRQIGRAGNRRESDGRAFVCTLSSRPDAIRHPLMTSARLHVGLIAGVTFLR